MGVNSRELFQKLTEDIDASFPKGLAVYPPIEGALVEEAFAAGILSSLTKKFVNSDDPVLAERAQQLFIHENNRMNEYNVEMSTSGDEILLNGVRNAFRDFFDPDDRTWWILGECFDRGRTGPGSALEARGGSFYQKLFDSPLTFTSHSLYINYIKNLEGIPAWKTANDVRSFNYGELQVSKSRLSFVPKTDLIARTICTEPSLNMFYQLGMGRLIEEKLRRVYNIDLSIQPDRNRRLTRVGSIDGSFSTIDLSSASDNFSLTLLRWLLKPNSSARGLIEMLRTPSTSLPSGEDVELHMVSTMGNGFTFPLQTLLFTCAVASVYRSYNIKPVNRNDTQNYAVFGDDIVVKTETFDRLCHLLQLLGFQVNGSKSFSKGFFRESCGSDYFHGQNVRGVYIKDLSSQQARYSAINRLNEWSSKSGILLPKTIHYLLRSVEYFPVPRMEADVSGIKIPFWMYERQNHRKKRKGSYLYFKPLPLTVAIDCPKCLKSGTPCPHINTEGALVSFLHGSLRGGRISPRQRAVRYILKARNVAVWSDIPSAPSQDGQALPWDMTVWLNLKR
jgi:hypothetical protein